MSGYGSWMLPAVGLTAVGAGAGVQAPVACKTSAKINSKALHPMVQSGYKSTWLTTSALIAVAGVFVLLVTDLHRIRGLHFLAVSISPVGTALVPTGQICVRLGEAAAAAS